MLVKSQIKQGSILSTVWSWLYAVVSSAPVNHWVHKHSSPPVTVNVAVEPCLVRENHCPLVVGCYGHLCWTQPLLAGEVAPPHTEVVARLQCAREVLHGLCQSSDLQIGVLPDQGPASSIQLHLTVHLWNRGGAVYILLTREAMCSQKRYSKACTLLHIHTLLAHMHTPLIAQLLRKLV